MQPFYTKYFKITVISKNQLIIISFKNQLIIILFLKSVNK